MAVGSLQVLIRWTYIRRRQNVGRQILNMTIVVVLVIRITSSSRWMMVGRQIVILITIMVVVVVVVDMVNDGVTVDTTVIVFRTGSISHRSSSCSSSS